VKDIQVKGRDITKKKFLKGHSIKHVVSKKKAKTTSVEPEERRESLVRRKATIEEPSWKVRRKLNDSRPLG